MANEEDVNVQRLQDPLQNTKITQVGYPEQPPTKEEQEALLAQAFFCLGLTENIDLSQAAEHDPDAVKRVGIAFIRTVVGLALALGLDIDKAMEKGADEFNAEFSIKH